MALKDDHVGQDKEDSAQQASQVRERVEKSMVNKDVRRGDSMAGYFTFCCHRS